MKRVSSTISAVFVLSAGMTAAATAADIVPSPPPPQTEFFTPAPTWTGLYAGVQGGYAWGDVDTEVDLLNSGTIVDTTSYDIDGGFGGGHLGYNQQLGNWVVGIEGEVNGAGISGGAAIPGAHGDPTDALSSDADWFGSVALRAGVLPTDNFLLYGVGGFGFAGFDHTLNDTSAGYAQTLDETHTGFTVGAGGEFKADENWTFRMEYRYYGLNDTDLSVPASAPSAFAGDRLGFDPDFHTVRAGVSYQFPPN